MKPKKGRKDKGSKKKPQPTKPEEKKGGKSKKKKREVPQIHRIGPKLLDLKKPDHWAFPLMDYMKNIRSADLTSSL